VSSLSRSEKARVWFTCESCGKAFFLRRCEVNRRKVQASKYGKSRSSYGILRFCKKNCRQERGLAYMRENPKARGYIVKEKFGVSDPTVSTWRKIVKKEKSDGLH